MVFSTKGCGSKLNHQGTTGLSPWFLLPGFYFGYLFLTHSPKASPGRRGGGPFDAMADVADAEAAAAAARAAVLRNDEDALQQAEDARQALQANGGEAAPRRKRREFWVCNFAASNLPGTCRVVNIFIYNNVLYVCTYLYVSLKACKKMSCARPFSSLCV